MLKTKLPNVTNVKFNTEDNLSSNCYSFNITFDDKEFKISKEFKTIKKDQSYEKFILFYFLKIIRFYNSKQKKSLTYYLKRNITPEEILKKLFYGFCLKFNFDYYDNSFIFSPLFLKESNNETIELINKIKITFFSENIQIDLLNEIEKIVEEDFNRRKKIRELKLQIKNINKKMKDLTNSTNKQIKQIKYSKKNSLNRNTDFNTKINVIIQLMHVAYILIHQHHLH